MGKLGALFLWLWVFELNTSWNADWKMFTLKNVATLCHSSSLYCYTVKSRSYKHPHPPPPPDTIPPLIIPLKTKLGNGLANIETSTHWSPWLLGFTFWCRITTLCHPSNYFAHTNSQNSTHYITVVIRLHFLMQNNHVVPSIETTVLIPGEQSKWDSFYHRGY